MKDFLRTFNKAQKGFTMTEILIVMAIFGIVSVMLFAAFGQSIDYFNRGQRKAAVIQQARSAMELMSRNLREATSFSEAAAAAITFVQNDYDSDANGSDDSIRFSLETSGGGTSRIRKDANAALQRYLTDTGVNVNNLTFSYFSTDAALDTNGDGFADATEIDAGGNGDSVINGAELNKINYVKISLTIDKTHMGATSTMSLATSVYLRNLR